MPITFCLPYTRKILLLLLTLTALLDTASTQSPYYFKHYEVEHGLSNNTVLCSIQDKKGFMWFGTIDGLNRFDGYSFKTFRNDPANPKSLGNNSVFTLCSGNDESIWVGTNKGLYKYDPVGQSFKLIPSTVNQRVRSLCTDNKGKLWFSLNNALSCYNEKMNSLFSTFE